MGMKVGEVVLDAHPESFQLEKSGTRFFVNTSSAVKVSLMSCSRRMPITTTGLHAIPYRQAHEPAFS